MKRKHRLHEAFNPYRNINREYVLDMIRDDIEYLSTLSDDEEVYAALKKMLLDDYNSAYIDERTLRAVSASLNAMLNACELEPGALQRTIDSYYEDEECESDKECESDEDEEAVAPAWIYQNIRDTIYDNERELACLDDDEAVFDAIVDTIESEYNMGTMSQQELNMYLAAAEQMYHACELEPGALHHLLTSYGYFENSF